MVGNEYLAQNPVPRCDSPPALQQLVTQHINMVFPDLNSTPPVDEQHKEMNELMDEQDEETHEQLMDEQG